MELISWMSKLPDTQLFTLTNLVCSHDSSAFNMNCIHSCFSRTQYLNYEDQLNIGIRHFDIRIRTKSSGIETNEDVVTCHGICDCRDDDGSPLSYKKILTTFKTFLQSNPTETICFNLQSGSGDKIANMTRGITIFYSICGDIAIDYDRNLTIGELRGKIICSPHLNPIARQKMILPKIPPSIDQVTDLSKIHKEHGDYEVFKVNGELKIQEVKTLLKKHNFSFKKAKLLTKKKTLVYPIKYEVSCTGEHSICFCPCPQKEANKVNQFFMEKEFVKGKYYGWIGFDFVTKEIANKIVETNFGESEDDLDDIDKSTINDMDKDVNNNNNTFTIPIANNDYNSTQDNFNQINNEKNKEEK